MRVIKLESTRSSIDCYVFVHDFYAKFVLIFPESNYLFFIYFINYF